MGKIDKGMSNIDLQSPRLQLQVRIAMRQNCDTAWRWDHGPDQWKQEPQVLLWLVTGGKATLRSVSGECQVRRGDFFVMPWDGFAYQGRHDPATPLEVAWLIFKLVDERGRTCRAQNLPDIPFHTALTDVPFANRLMDRVIDATGDRQGQWLRVLLDEVRQQGVSHGASETERQIRELGRLIQANPGRYRGVDDMRVDCRYSKDHLIRLFRRYQGATPGEFLIRTRIDSARGLLAASGLSIKQIAAQLGYADAFSFSRQFKLRTGLSPSAFRERQ